MLLPVTKACPTPRWRGPAALARSSAYRGASWLTLASALLAGCLVGAAGAEGEVAASAREVTTIEQVVKIGTNLLMAGPVAARVQGVVIFVSPLSRRLYVQHGEFGVQANLSTSVTAFRVGQRVELSGKVEDALPTPRLVNTTASVLGEEPLPEPLPSSAHRFALGNDFLRLVKFRGVVRDIRSERDALMLLLTAEGLPFELSVQSTPGPLPREWLDAELEAVGFAFPFYTPEGRRTGFRVHAASTNFLRVVRAGGSNLFDRPLLTIAEVARQPRAWQPRYKVAGTVTLHRGPDLYIDDGTGALHVNPIGLLAKPTQGESLPHEPQTPLRPGERVEVIGVRQNWYFLAPMLLLAEYRRVGTAPPVPPVPVTPADLKAGRHAGKLVSVEARLLNQRTWGDRSTRRHLMMLQAGEEVFQATWAGDQPAKWDVKLDSFVRLTGINEAQSGQMKDRITFELRLRGPEDITPIPPPPFWTRPAILKPLLAALSVAILATVWMLVQRRQMRRLRASEERLRALIDNSFDVTLVLNADGTAKYLSPSGVRLFGEVTGSPTGRSIASFVHPEDLPRILEAHREVLQETGRSRGVSRYRVLTRDGTVRYAEAIGTNCLDVPGVEGVVVNLRDITERELAQQELERSELLHRRMNEFATSLSPLHTEEDILWEITRQCISVLGFADCVIYLLDESRGTLAQKAAFGPKNPREREIIAPIEIPVGRGIVGCVARTGMAEIIEDTSRDPRYIVDDQCRFSEIAVPILSEGRVLGVIDSEHPQRAFFTKEHLTVLTSIASLCANKLVRARAEQRLRESHEDLERHIAARTGELVTANARLTLEIADRARAEKVQQALYSISEAIHRVDDLPSLYRRIHEIIGMLMPAGNLYIALYDPTTEMVSFPYHCDEMDPPPSPRKGRRGMTEYVLRTGRSALADLDEIARLKAAGEYIQSGAPAKIWLGVPLSRGGYPFGVMAVQDHHNPRVYGQEEMQILSFIADQTALAIERKRAQDDLRVALQAEKELNQLKGSFVSMVSHEFRTPLGVILSSSNILDNYLDRLSPEKRAAQLRAIRKSVHRMNDLIEDVLLLGKFDAGALGCQPVPLDLVSFCQHAAKEIESATGRDGAILFTPTDISTGATADEGLLQHILANLLGNSVKYSPPDQSVEFRVIRRGPDAEFVIRDRGCGIPTADQARLFTAFYRGSNVGHKPGSGLGLVIAKRCVDLHCGTIRCDSEPGRGTTFTVTLPLFDGTRFFRRRPYGGSSLAEMPVLTKT